MFLWFLGLLDMTIEIRSAHPPAMSRELKRPVTALAHYAQKLFH